MPHVITEFGLIGTSDLLIELDIEAGEESANTDALVDLSFYDYEETEISVAESETEIGMEVLKLFITYQNLVLFKSSNTSFPRNMLQ